MGRSKSRSDVCGEERELAPVFSLRGVIDLCRYKCAGHHVGREKGLFIFFECLFIYWGCARS